MHRDFCLFVFWFLFKYWRVIFGIIGIKVLTKKTNRVHIFDRTHRLRSVCSLCSKFPQIIPEINKSNLSFLSQSGKIPPKSNAEMNVQVKKRLIYFLCSTQTVLMLRDLIFDDYKYRIKQVNQTAAPVLFCFFIINLQVKLFNGSFGDSWEGNWLRLIETRKVSEQKLEFV